MIRIGVDARPLTVPTFGIGRYTEEVLKRMLMLGPDHHWFLYADRPLPGLWPKNVTVRQYAKHRPTLSLLRTQVGYSFWAWRDQLDVFWSPRHHLPLLGMVPKVLTVHDIVWKKFPETMQAANLWVERRLMPASLKQAIKVITISNATKQDLILELGVPENIIEVTHLAADVGTPANAAREIETSYFFFVGTNEPRKNLQRLVAAHKKYREMGGEHHLVIAGGAGWGEGIEPHDGVTILGYVEEARLDGLIRNSVALVLPSIYEGFGIPLVEAIKRDVPVISSNVSAMPEVVGNCGLLVDPMDVDDIEKGLVAMSNPKIRDMFSRKCAAHGEAFSWDDAAQKTFTILERIGSYT